MTAPLSAGAIIDMLVVRYADPEWVFATEVTIGSRRLDALAMNQWESRGRLLVGFEVKVSRSDWLRELKDFQKAETTYREVDQFYLVTPKDVVQPGELPVGWGHLEVRGTQLRQVVAPARVAPSATMNREVAVRLLSRLLRKDRQEYYQRQHKLEKGLRAELEQSIADRFKHRLQGEIEERERVQANYRELVAAFGIDPNAWKARKDALRAAGMLSLVAGDLDGGRMIGLRAVLTNLIARSSAAIEALDAAERAFTATAQPASPVQAESEAVLA